MRQLRSRARPVVALKVYVCSPAKTVANSSGSLRVAWQQMLVDAFRALGNYTTVFVEANHDDPIVDVSWPLAAWQ